MLLLGYGNPGRLDDGLGPALAAQVERLALPGVTVRVGLPALPSRTPRRRPGTTW